MKIKSIFLILLPVLSSYVPFLTGDTVQVKDLPIVITRSITASSETPIALIISGDGGWYHFEQSIADKLAQKGIPTIGLDSRKYFWSRKTPDEAASDMGRALNHYAKEWDRENFMLIGYSLGAEIVPFIVNRLPVSVKSKVVSVVLLSPATTTDFEIHLTNMLGLGNKQNTYYTVNEIANLQGIPTLIIFGDGEKTRIPQLLEGTLIKVKKIPGDHHYKFDMPLIMKTMSDNNAF